MTELEQFQLLRPLWLLGLLPVIWLLWKAWSLKSQQGAWHQVIDPKFRHLLLGTNQTGEVSLTNKLSITALGLIWLIAIIALSGPSLKSVEMPAEKNQQGTVILLDLSLSMLADDLAPNRISHVKYKITDLLKRHPELSIGMVSYAGSAHAISPISEDNQTLLSILPALNPVIMPSYGSNPLQGFTKAKQLFEGAHITQGHIIWITDDIESNEKVELQRWLKSHNYSLSILTVGTESGGAVQLPEYGLLKDDSGKIILPSLPFDRFQSLAQQTGISLNRLTPSSDSVAMLLPPVLSSKQTKEIEESDKTEDNRIIHPLDAGAFLLFLLVPLVGLLYRRGWVLSLTLLSMPLAGFLATGLLAVGMLTPTTSQAETTLPNFMDAFKSPDQQAYQAYQNNNLEAANNLFEDPQWRASTLYDLGKYKEAAELFARDNTAQGHYNHGNALAKSGQLEAAKTAYETALEQQPDMRSVSKNLEIVKQLLNQQKEQDKQKSDEQKQDKNQQQDQESSESSESDEGESGDPSDQQSEGKNSENGESSESDPSTDPSDSDQADSAEKNQNDKEKSEAKDSGLKDEAVPKADKAEQGEQEKEAEAQQASDTQNEDKAANSDNGISDDENSSEENRARLADKDTDKELDKQQSPSQNQQQQERQQATQNWLKQIPDEPGLFLKRKFEYQYQQQPTQAVQPSGNNKQW